jgi:hypothetical protein
MSYASRIFCFSRISSLSRNIDTNFLGGIFRAVWIRSWL